jgi:hypothetical protein
VLPGVHIVNVAYNMFWVPWLAATKEAGPASMTTLIGVDPVGATLVVLEELLLPHAPNPASNAQESNPIISE